MDTKLTPKQKELLGFITAECIKHGCVRLSKKELALKNNCCLKTMDRAVRKLQAEGYIEVKETFDIDGAQLVNEYRIASK